MPANSSRCWPRISRSRCLGETTERRRPGFESGMDPAGDCLGTGQEKSADADRFKFAAAYPAKNCGKMNGLAVAPELRRRAASRIVTRFSVVGSIIPTSPNSPLLRATDGT